MRIKSVRRMVGIDRGQRAACAHEAIIRQRRKGHWFRGGLRAGERERSGCWQQRKHAVSADMMRDRRCAIAQRLAARNGDSCDLRYSRDVFRRARASVEERAATDVKHLVFQRSARPQLVRR